MAEQPPGYAVAALVVSWPVRWWTGGLTCEAMVLSTQLASLIAGVLLVVPMYRLGKELYDRLQVMANHWAAMGQALKRAVTSYNDAVGSLDSRVMASARRFRELNIGEDGKEVELPRIESTPREVQSDELRPQLPRITPRDSR